MLSKKIPFIRRDTDRHDDIAPADNIEITNQGKDAEHGAAEDDKEGLELPNESAQGGVKDIEAVTISWSKKSLAAVYVW